MKKAPESVTARDAGLRLISRINRWLIAGALALAGVISLVAAKSFHGRTLNASAQSSGSGSGASSSSSTGNTGGGLEQPAQSPAPASSASGPVVSGGS